MLVKRATLLSILALLLLAGARTQADLTEAISGKLIPLIVKMSDLDGEWRRFTVGPEASGPSAYVDASIIMRAQETGVPPTSVYYTRGWTQGSGDETYLVAYQTKSMLTTIAMMMLTGEEDTRKLVLTPESELTMSLLNLRTMGSMKDIRAVNLGEEIAESKALFGAEEPAAREPVTDQSFQNLRVIGQSLSVYIQAWDDKLPPMKSPEQVKKLLQPYASQIRPGAESHELFTDPRTGELYPVNTVLSEHKLAHIQFPQDMAVYYEAVPSEDGTRAVLFLDGHIKRASPEGWAIIKRKSKIP